jgi:hypothetical protein
MILLAVSYCSKGPEVPSVVDNVECDAGDAVGELASVPGRGDQVVR